MPELTEWIGKADDIRINYEVGFKGTPLMLNGMPDTLLLPAEVQVNSENDVDVVDVEWESSVKKADRADYIIAVCCGSVAGLVDSFYVGEFSLERAATWGEETVAKFVIKAAKLSGFDGIDLPGAIDFMQKKFRFAADSNIFDYGGSTKHHLRDFSHHFSLGGLLCSLFTQFSKLVIGTDEYGILKIVPVSNQEFIGKNFAEKILFGTVNWFFHMVSDMAGTNLTAGKGTGIPGPLVSIIKEMSAFPIFKNAKISDTEFSKWISELYSGKLIAIKDDAGNVIKEIKFDLRTEIGILHELGRQVIPVLINECMVRGAYFIRRLYMAIVDADIKTFSDIKRIDPSELLPFNNRTVKRMVTVSSGTFTAVDSVDSLVRAAVKSGGEGVTLATHYFLGINYFGIGRFILAVAMDSKYIVEDVKEEYKNNVEAERAGKEYERTISDLQCFILDYAQLRIMYSLQRLVISDDIANTKSRRDRDLKQKWQMFWEKRLLADLHVPAEEIVEFFMSEDKIVDYLVIHNTEGAWVHLVAMETALFIPYTPIHGDDSDKEYRKLKFKSSYMDDRFSKLQNYISKDEIISIRNEFKASQSYITGRTRKIVISAVGTTALIIVTGGLANVFAPAIAIGLAGESAAGLSGAALVSYSLAAVGGGALAAGGLGMAGGTAIITGGGALVGMIGGGMSSVTTLALLSDDGYVLQECCKLLTFCKVALLGILNDKASIKQIETKVGARIDDIESQLKTFEAENKKDKNLKKKIKVAKRSVVYLKRSILALKKLE